MVIPGVVQAIDMFDKEIMLLAKKTGVSIETLNTVHFSKKNVFWSSLFNILIARWIWWSTPNMTPYEISE